MSGPSSDIPPALTPSEWANVAKNQDSGPFLEFTVHAGRIPATLAIANAALHDEDPRKLRRDHVGALRRAAAIIEKPSAMRYFEAESHTGDPTLGAAAAQGELYSQLVELADVIESYLPPDRALTNPEQQ